MEKILNTRVLLKTDTLENWNNSTLALKKGEIAIATVAATAGTGLTEPVVMIKIGEDGVKTFNELPWNFYAKASDVIAACKSESTLTDFVNNVIAGAGIATDEALATLTGRVTTAEGNIDALEALVGNTAVDTQITNAVSAAKVELKGSDADTATSATIAGAKKYADSLDSAMDARVDALEAAIGEGGSVTEKIAAEIQKLDVEDTVVAGKYVSAVSEADGKITVTRADLPDYTNVYAAKEHDHAIADVTGLQGALDNKATSADVTALSGKVTTLISTDAGKSVRTIANEELAAQLIPENAQEALDTLSEIAAWIQSHPDNASAMNAAIEALQAKVGDSAVSVQITSAIDALKNGDIKSAVDRIAALEDDTHTHANKALLDTYTQTEADLADAVAKKHTHANATVLDGISAEKITAWDAAVQSITANTGLKATKSGTDITIDFDNSVTFIFNCGNSAI